MSERERTGGDDRGSSRSSALTGGDGAVDTLDTADSLLLALADAPDVAPAVRFEPGAVIADAFRIERELGTGGMGVVYLAHDLRLGRAVAIKLCGRLASEDAEARLHREATAMAALSHPNVVAVHEVGHVQGRVFIAMEYVGGGTVRDWLAEAPRSWRDTARLFAAAGRGLAAAHDAGLVHRDFKPENILRGTDGRVRVADFGLARARLAGPDAEPDAATDPVDSLADTDLVKAANDDGHDDHDDHDHDHAHDDDHDHDHDDVYAGVIDDDDEPSGLVVTAAGVFALGPGGALITRTGAVVGTPAYMAPEQWAGAEVDARADQFAFCVALHEALYGVRPFEGRTVTELAARVRAGELPDPPHGRKVPAHLQRALERGLSPDPEARHASMHELVAALERDPSARRRAWLVAAGAAVVAAGLASGASWLWGGGPACPSTAPELARVWNPDRAAAIERAFAASGAPYAREAWRRVRPRIDGFAAAWVDARDQACRDTHVRRVQSAALLDRRIACLGRARGELAAVLGVLSRAEPDVVRNAQRAVGSLPDLARCDDADGLLARVAPARPALTGEVEAVRAQVANAHALERAGKPGDALPIARAALARAETLGYPPLVAESLVQLAEVEVATAAFAEAERDLERAFFTARGAGHDPIVLRAAIGLIAVTGVYLARFGRADDWTRHALAEVTRHGEGSIDHARLLRTLGILTEARGDYPGSARQLAAALAMFRALRDDDDRDVVDTQSEIAVNLANQGKFAESVPVQREVLAATERLLGPDHPEVATVLSNLGLDLTDWGHAAEAEPLLRRALAIRERALGPDHVDTAYALLNLGVAVFAGGDGRAALPLYARGLAIVRATLGVRHPDNGLFINSMAAAHDGLGELAKARQMYAEAVAVFREAYGDRHAMYAMSLGNLADVQSRMGMWQDALRDGRRALAVWEGVAPDHPNSAFAHRAVGRALLDSGEPRAALVSLERALALHREATASAVEIAEDERLLALARSAIGGAATTTGSAADAKTTEGAPAGSGATPAGERTPSGSPGDGPVE